MRHLFTDQDILDWKEYENVRASGAFNMWTPQARAETGLTRERYLFVMQNFTALKEAYESQK